MWWVRGCGWLHRSLWPETPETNYKLNAADSPDVSAPIRHGEEWANALSHGAAATISVLLGIGMVREAGEIDRGLAIACLVYIVSVFATFSFSTASHAILTQPLLDRLRAWDQAMIYAMISGTYTPIIYRFSPEFIRMPLLIAIWVAALLGMSGKLLLRHRVNNVATVTYLLLGWLPAIPLYGQVPSGLGQGMLLGGVLYSAGVVVLMNVARRKYMHVVWHLFVMSAALCHFLVIRWYVIG